MDSMLSDFAAAMQGEAAIDKAALLLGRWDHPRRGANASLIPYLAHIESLALSATALFDESDHRIHSAGGPIMRAKAICTALFEVAGFRGNHEDYYDPRNSFLADVLDRRMGIPITLGVLYLEVARRCGVLAQGVNFPGQFLVRVAVEDAWMFVDVFNGGKILTPGDLEALVKRNVGPDAKLEPRLVAAASKRQIMTRMLTNLAGIYGKANDLERSIHVLEHMAIVDPDNSKLGRDLASLRDRINTLN
jgi:regulator of sirC expression with transglutaminase-like and TPR domain